ncbi:MAG: hypothetical protein KF696_01465 [Planctomycetes bacterium]|nr:hypothetical protein [Planctomycetota bacterium]MCW8134391.1 hypothetical protein [Planctomycetota bacterium]
MIALLFLASNPLQDSSAVVAQGAPQQGDHTFRITHIKFDHKGPDANDAMLPTDGLNIRRDAASDLQHLGNGQGEGEWIRSSRNEEACYISSKAVTIKVRIECDDYVRTARSHATQLGFDPTLPPSLKPWTEVTDTLVNFKESAPGSGLWVSFNNSPGVTDVEYVEFPLDGLTKSKIGKWRCTWQWKVKDVDSTTPAEPPDPNPQQYDVEDTGPHTFYTVLDTPFEPWYSGGDVTDPWIKALDFCIVELFPAGIRYLDVAAAQITDAIWLRAIPRYDHDQSQLQSRYVPDVSRLNPPLTVIPGEAESTLQLKFMLTDFIHGDHRLGDCFDLAAAVQTCANLMGVRGRFARLGAFGYINPVEFIAPLSWLDGKKNNPFHDRPGNSPIPLTGLDYLYEDVNPVDGLFDRSYFIIHTYVVYGGKALDATVGPFLGRQGEADYIAAVRDTSTRAETRVASTLNDRNRRFASILHIE